MGSVQEIAACRWQSYSGLWEFLI